MDYEFETLRFYDWLETNSVGTSCIALWHALLHTWQKAGYPVEFAVAISVLETKTGLKRDAIYSARNKLKQAGRIDWTERKGNQSAIYTFVSFKPIQTPIQNNYVGLNDTIPDTNSHTNPTQNPTQNICVDLTDTNNHTKPTQIQNASFKPIQTPTQDQFVSFKPHINSSSNSSGSSSGSSSNYINNHIDISTTTPITNNNVSENPTQIKNSFTYYEQCFGPMRYTVMEEIKDFFNQGLTDELICLAMDRTLDSEKNKQSWSYARGILDRCVMQKIFTPEEFIDKETEHKRNIALNKGSDTTGGSNKPGDSKNISRIGKSNRFAGVVRKDAGTGEPIS